MMEIFKKSEKVFFLVSVDFSPDFPALSSKHQQMKKVSLGLGNVMKTKDFHKIPSVLCCTSML